MPSPSIKKKQSSLLVADQPGLSWSFAGLFLALFIGFSIRVLISPQHIQAKVEEALSHSGPDVAVEVGDSFLSLSDGLFPELSIVIKDISFTSEKACWGRPDGAINELRLPIQFWPLFKGQVAINLIAVDELTITLHEELKHCESANGTGSKSGSEGYAQAQSPLVPLSPGASRQAQAPSEFESLMDTLEIRKMRVNYEPVSFTSIELQRLTVQRLHQEKFTGISVAGNINLFGETLSGDYSSTADLNVEYHEGDQASLKMDVSGYWREGSYTAMLDVALAKREYNFIGEVEHIPLSQVFPLLKKYKIMENDFNGKQSWMSFQLKSAGSLSSPEKSSAKINKFKIEGDVGQVESEVIDILSLQPLKARPMNFTLSGFDFDKLLIFFGRPHPSPALGRLGVFNGSLLLRSPEDVEIVGEHSGLEFIFSNRGHREVQTMSLLSGEMTLQKDRWRVLVRRMRPLEGILEGNVVIKADRNWKQLEVDMSLDELTLSPKIQKLMMSGGDIGPISGDLNLQFASGGLKQMRGIVKLQKLSSEGVRVSNSKLRFETNNGEVTVDAGFSEIGVDPKATAGEVFRPLLMESMLTQGELVLKTPSVHIRTKQLQRLEWSHLQSQLGLGRLSSQGEWNEEGRLQGSFQYRQRDLEKKWKIHGDRNHPEIEPVDKSDKINKE